MRYVNLTEEEIKLVENLYKTSKNHLTRERSLCLLLLSKGYFMQEISKLSSMDYQKIMRLFNAWEKSEDKFSSLSRTIEDIKGKELTLNTGHIYKDDIRIIHSIMSSEKAWISFDLGNFVSFSMNSKEL